MDQKTNKSLKDELSLAWDILKTLALFLAIYLLFAGWLYLYYYFHEVGMSYGMMKFEITSIYNYGFLALMHNQMLINCSVFILLIGVIYYIRRLIFLAKAVLFSLVVIFFVLSYLVVKRDAAQDADRVCLNRAADKAFFPVYFDFTKNFLASMAKDSLEKTFLSDDDSSKLERTRKNGVKLLHYNNSLSLSLFFENDEYYYAMYNPNKKGDYTYAIQIFCINKKDLNYVSTYKTNIETR